MSKMSKDLPRAQSRGEVSVLVAILIAVVCLVLGVVIGYYLSAGKIATTTTTSAITTAPSGTTATTAASTASWKTYTNTQYGFSIKYPDGYQPTVSTGDCGGDQCYIVNFGDKIGINIYQPSQRLINYGLKAPNGMEPTSSSDATVDGVVAKKYEGTNPVYVFLSANNNRFEIGVTAKNPDKTMISNLTQMVKTFKFTP